MTRRAWSWATGTPRERAEFVRNQALDLRVSGEQLCEIFRLTPMGLVAILRGADWGDAFSTIPAARNQGDAPTDAGDRDSAADRAAGTEPPSPPELASGTPGGGDHV